MTKYPKAVTADVATKPLVTPPTIIKAINEILSPPWSPYDRSTGRTYPIGKIGLYTPHVRQYYTAAGWVVTYESDQREGDFLRFTTEKHG